MPLQTILIVAGSWLILIFLTIWKYRFWKNGGDD